MQMIKCETLICFLDEFNGPNVYACINLKPKNIVFICEEREELKETFQALEEYLWSKLPFSKIEIQIIKRVNYENLSNIINQHNRETTVLNISNGDRLLNLLAVKICEKENYNYIFVDLDKELILDLNSNIIESLQLQLQEMEVKDFIASTGGEIYDECTRLYDDEIVQKMMEYILDNYNIWVRLKAILRNTYIIHYNECNPNIVTINKNLIENFNLFKGFFDRAVELNLFEITYSSSVKLTLSFSNMNYKSFVFKAGTWLEVLVYKIVKEIKEIDDARAGVVFLWDDENTYVRNEADVLASANSKLVYISCKDTANYDEAALNEIEVYSEQIGGEDAKKVLVTTREPNKKVVLSRAEEMDIKVIIFDGDLEKFKMKLSIVVNG